MRHWRRCVYLLWGRIRPVEKSQENNTVKMQIFFNGEPREVEQGITVAVLLAELDLKPRYVAVEVNLDLVPRDRHQEFVLQEGDRLEVVTLVGGG